MDERKERNKRGGKGGGGEVGRGVWEEWRKRVGRMRVDKEGGWEWVGERG